MVLNLLERVKKGERGMKRKNVTFDCSLKRSTGGRWNSGSSDFQLNKTETRVI